MGEGRLLQRSPLYRGSRLLNQYIPCHGRLGSSTNGNGTSCGLDSRELLVEDASSFGGEKETCDNPEITHSKADGKLLRRLSYRVHFVNKMVGIGSYYFSVGPLYLLYLV